jgi:hypothetical protein
MDKEPKKKSSKEELDELKEVMNKLQKLQEEKRKRESNQKKPRRPVIAIEFGAVFHPNPYVNLVFTAIVNFVFAYFVIEFFHFAEYYNKIVVLLILMAIYTVLEEIYKNMILRYYFHLIIKSFGTVFFFGYLLIFFILDHYVFIQDFNFINGTLLAFFVLIFVITRYLFGSSVRKYFRKKRI